MNGRDAWNRVVASDGAAGFTAVAWDRLPEFLNSRAPERWWLVPSFCVRVLSEFAALSRLDLIQIPAVRNSSEPRATVAGPDSAAAVECISQLTVIGTRATMAVVPSIDVLRAASPGMAAEDVEDELRDLVSELLNAGADAICVKGNDAMALAETIEGLGRIVRHFGRVLVGVALDSAVSGTDNLDVFGVRIGDPWPTTGLVMATGDLSQESPILLQEWIRTRA